MRNEGSSSINANGRRRNKHYKRREKRNSNAHTLEDRYVLKKKICQGGFGKVYEASDKVEKRNVIIKVNAEIDMNDNEFEIMKHLSDKNLKGFPKVYSSGIIEN